MSNEMSPADVLSVGKEVVGHLGADWTAKLGFGDDMTLLYGPESKEVRLYLVSYRPQA